MAGAKIVSQVEVLPADESGRRRGWTDLEKIRIVEESLRGYRQGSATARRCGISRSLLTRWRKEYRLGLLCGAPAAFTALRVTPDPAPLCSGGDPKIQPVEQVEITLTNGRRLSVAAAIDGTALARLVQVLERA